MPDTVTAERTAPPQHEPSTGPAREDVAVVADRFIALVRSFNRARARMLAAAAHDVEWSAHILLKLLHTEGPKRAGALAEILQSDPSTISRQVATLVKDGLVERQADPDDGRASLLVLTAKANEVLAEHDAIRLRYFDEMLRDWTPEELRNFAVMLARFTDDYENASNDLTARIPNRSAAAERND